MCILLSVWYVWGLQALPRSDGGTRWRKENRAVMYVDRHEAVGMCRWRMLPAASLRWRPQPPLQHSQGRPTRHLQ